MASTAPGQMSPPMLPRLAFCRHSTRSENRNERRTALEKQERYRKRYKTSVSPDQLVRKIFLAPDSRHGNDKCQLLIVFTVFGLQVVTDF